MGELGASGGPRCGRGPQAAKGSGEKGTTSWDPGAICEIILGWTPRNDYMMPRAILGRILPDQQPIKPQLGPWDDYKTSWRKGVDEAARYATPHHAPPPQQPPPELSTQSGDKLPIIKGPWMIPGQRTRSSFGGKKSRRAVTSVLIPGTWRNTW